MARSSRKKRTPETTTFNQPFDKSGVRLVQLLNAGKYIEVEQAARLLLQRFPKLPVALKSLASSLVSQRRHVEAIAILEQAISGTPKDAELLADLGISLFESGWVDEAIASFSKAVELAPGYIDNYTNLAIALERLGRDEALIECCHKIIELRPTNYGAYCALGKAFLRQKKYLEAVQALAKAVELHPDEYYPDAVTSIGVAFIEMGRFAEAHALYRELREQKLENGSTLGRLIQSSLHICEWESLEMDCATLRVKIANDVRFEMGPWMYLAMPGLTADDHGKVAAAYAETCLSNQMKRQPISEVVGKQRDNHRRLRIGYLSADFREHATSHLLVGVFENHDRSCFEVFGYSYGRDDGSPMRDRLAQSIEVFRDFQPMSHEQAACQIRNDGVDILIDLKGWTTDTRMEILALRPAPVLVSWLGYPGSLAHPRLADYVIGDPVVTPLEHEAFYSETLALMPHCYQPNDRMRVIGAKPARADVGLPERGFVFCSFNQSFKINPSIFDIWCRLLNEVDGSVLWLLDPNDAARDNLRREARARGIDPTRLIFAPFVPLVEHLGRLQCADLALDTFPCGSHTTGSDALWAGVPLLACKGDTFAGRVSSSLVTAAGVPGLIASSPDEYYLLARRLAGNPEELALIRRRLAEARLSCPLFDTRQFTRDIERLFVSMWEDYLSGVKRPIALAPERPLILPG